MTTRTQDLDAALRRHFGHPAFRPGQREAITPLLEGRDVLLVMPTGAGKSLIYQLAAQLLPGVTVVVSPLLALMKDQVDAVEEHGLEVGVVNSSLSESESESRLREVESGAAKLLYVTPERFDNAEFMHQMRDVDVSLFVVDEAHCISQWGHSFRPAYLGLAAARAALGSPTTLALTATASPWVRDEIEHRLEMRRPLVMARGADRPNLFLETVRVERESDDLRVLERMFAGEDLAGYPDDLAADLREAMTGSGIIYTATTRAARETAEWLRGQGIDAAHYHGQQRKAERTQVQDAFLGGDLRVVVATNAFGMGVDKPDVRFVVHRDVPASLEAYYQEAGRAGRDGAFARCTLIFRPGDIGRAAFLGAAGELTADEAERAARALRELRECTLTQLSAHSEVGRADVARLVAIMEGQGIARERRGRVRLLRDDFDPAAIPLEEEEHRRAYERSRREMMRGYADTHECRRAFILGYFAEELPGGHCTMCDNDTRGEAARARAEGSEDAAAAGGDDGWAPGVRVRHEAWGEGTVHRVGDGALTVLFESEGYKTLDVGLVRDRALLVPVDD
ncbi:MAG TPA: RecQ family ATP-dependent DNA helicase [Miltoncostaeaceae bacterium]|nr:RecQ family ATP-dependent DNA helicase [Miltoncostaeaceae bacterium]